MSTYKSIVKHPQTGVYELATWIDDYYGPHIYGCEFDSDGKVYPRDIVEDKQVYDFWKDDVLNAYERVTDADQTKQVEFLNAIQAQYVARWKEDPITGNGATEKSKILKKNQ